MSIGDFLYRVLIYPLELLFEVVFEISEEFFHNPGISIIVLSLVVNFLILPMYQRADVMQAEERDKEAKLAKWTAHIKSTFKGDERFMMLQTYYRQENYKQLYVLKSSIPLLLQVPFFMAAYNFLSKLNYIKGASIGPIKDLANPDQLLVLGGLTLNLLPILMTAINIVSGMVYSKGFPIKTKIQMYGIALVFLVLLYDSPSGLVFYWTLNNVFSLGKNIVTAIIKKFGPFKLPDRLTRIDLSDKADSKVFLVGAINLAVFVGLAIPMEIVSCCPQEYIKIQHYFNPLLLVWYSFATALGIFVVWFGVFYFLAKKNTKSIYAYIVAILSFVGMYNKFSVQYTRYKLNQYFCYDRVFDFSKNEKVINLLVIVAILVVVFAIWKWKRQFLVYALLTSLIAMSVLSIKYYRISAKELDDVYFTGDRYLAPADINLSQDGQNVVVIMLDRSMGKYYPYIMESYPDLKEAYSDFTYYPNTISYGQNTIFGVPALYGGPEYSVEQMNVRTDMSMADKLNEALLVMPKLFSDNGFDVTVADPPYAGYKWIPDISIFEEYGIDAYVTNGAYADDLPEFEDMLDSLAARQLRNIFGYSVSRCTPICLSGFVYNNGNYHAIEYKPCTIEKTSSFSPSLNDALTTLNHFTDMTVIKNDDSNNFTIISNETTHNTSLSNPDFDNVIYVNGKPLDLSDPRFKGAFQINATGLERVAQWMEYLKANGVYDNTRIIIVGDHGYYYYQDPAMVTEDGVDLMAIYPLLIVKDFNQTEGGVNDDFMTIGAVPYLATKDVIDNPVNPFTGTPFNLDFLNEQQIILISTAKMPHDNPGNQYAGGDWYIIHGDSYDNFELESIATPGK